ncbi:hypothetical protein BJN34_36020 (plasmid) [Cupriavidus necator]|uniref:CENP-V/GFA domain-containing protein n=1 Tax=Cupriavidus necator TaxID=106590 RepID=A0A1U9V4G0_CUPNE|nr:GFA family protein [Cupriavidus necator]AQV99285.1 hypothetical protein BJN34_36020 [Cupriavidus necator]
MSEIQGGCLCGAVRYESADTAITSVVCHCSQCQKQSGSAFSINLVVPAAGFRVIASALATYHDVGDSGLAVLRHFCTRCGSPVYSELDANPGVVAVKAGTLDDPSRVHPQLHMWRDSAQPWVEIADDAVCFPRNAVA